MRDPANDSLTRSGAPMAGKTGSDLEELRTLLAEVKALREAVEDKAAEFRIAWGADADKTKAPPRVLNLSHYIALREHDVTDLQYRLASRGLSSLGRSESHIAQALDALIATLKRLSGESDAAYPAPVLAQVGGAELEAEADRLFGKRQKGGPRARVMASLPPEAATEPGFVDKLVAAGMDCARINCAHDDPEIWGRMIENVRGAGARLERPCRVLMDIAGPKCRILRVKVPPKTRTLARRPHRSHRRIARENQGADRLLAQFSRTRRPALSRLGSVHRRRQGRGPGRLQGAGPGGD